MSKPVNIITNIRMFEILLSRSGDAKPVLTSQRTLFIHADSLFYPPLYSKTKDSEQLVICKFFLALTKWTWFATEFDGKDTFFGFVCGEYPELKYFSLSELENLEVPYGLGVERDRYFEPVRLSEIQKHYS